MRTRSIGCVLLLGCWLPLAAAAQAPGRITGVVRSDAGLPVPNAQITVQATALRALTDTAGRFRLTNVSPGPHTVKATALGHSPQQLDVNVQSGAEVTTDFKLPVIATNLDAVVVVGYGEQRKSTITSAVANVTS